MSTEHPHHSGNAVGVSDQQSDPFSSADGMTARRLVNTSGEPSLDRAREAFDRAMPGNASNKYRPGTDRASGAGQSETGGNAALMLLCGIGIGAALMYLLDPAQGESRRSAVLDKVSGAASKAGDLIGASAGEDAGGPQLHNSTADAATTNATSSMSEAAGQSA
jgi:hypothetical protein